MWIVCLADDSHEMLSLIYSEKYEKKKKIRMSAAAGLRVKRNISASVLLHFVAGFVNFLAYIFLFFTAVGCPYLKFSLLAQKGCGQLRIISEVDKLLAYYGEVC